MTTDPYFKKKIEFSFQKKHLEFNVSQQIFSSFDVDQGSKLLLKTLANLNHTFEKVLDLGCGYGVLGLTLNALNAKSEVHLVDCDALAIEYTKQNASLNKLYIKAYGSLGYDSVSEKFDLIISNIPAKAGKPILGSFLIDCKYFLNKDGIMAIVVVNELADFIEQVLEAESDISISTQEKGKGHTVFHYQFSELPTETYQSTIKSAFESGVYDRDFVNDVKTVYGLPEFDSLSFNTQLTLKSITAIKNLHAQNILIQNPGQGHITIALLEKLQPKKITLFDRDLLALENTRRNLLTQGFKKENIINIHETHLSQLDQNIDFAVCMLRDDDAPEIMQYQIKQIEKQLTSQGTLILSGTSTQITRAINFIRAEKLFTIMERKKWRAQSVLILQKS